MPTAPYAVHRLTTAVEQARHARHHTGCDCGVYRDADGAPYCSSSEFRWNSLVNSILTTVCREQSKPAGTSIR